MAGIDEAALGRDAVRHMTLTLDATRLRRGAFGWCDWRLRLAKVLFRLGCRVLRCKGEVGEPCRDGGR